MKKRLGIYAGLISVIILAGVIYVVKMNTNKISTPQSKKTASIVQKNKEDKNSEIKGTSSNVQGASTDVPKRKDTSQGGQTGGTKNPSQSKSISQDDALNIVKKSLGNMPSGHMINYDHSQEKDGKNFYVFRYYNQSGTIGWFYIDKATGKIYVLRLYPNTLDEYIPGKTQINE